MAKRSSPPEGQRAESFRKRLAELIAKSPTKKAVYLAADISEGGLDKILTGDRPNPQLFTVKDLADALGTSVGYLLGEESLTIDADHRQLMRLLDSLSREDRDHLMAHFRWLISKAASAETADYAKVLQFPEPLEHASGDDFELPIPIDQMKENDVDRPQPLHAWMRVIEAEPAAGPPRDVGTDALIPTATILNSIREVRDDRVKVVKVFGDSMEPLLWNGWKVLLDPARARFLPGRIVVVYLKDAGLSIGIYRKSEERQWLEKKNKAYPAVTLDDGEWYPIGTITKIVEAEIVVD